MKPTKKTFEIRTVRDFFLVPAGRRSACLRDFETWIRVGLELEKVFGVENARLCRDAFVWNDDGQPGIKSVKLRVVEARND